MDYECVGRMKPTKLLNELSNMMKLEYNMSFLEWIFDKCGESKLVKECQEFSAEHHNQLECFNTNFTPCRYQAPFTRQHGFTLTCLAHSKSSRSFYSFYQVVKVSLLKSSLWCLNQNHTGTSSRICDFGQQNQYMCILVKFL